MVHTHSRDGRDLRADALPDLVRNLLDRPGPAHRDSGVHAGDVVSDLSMNARGAGGPRRADVHAKHAARRGGSVRHDRDGIPGDLLDDAVVHRQPPTLLRRDASGMLAASRCVRVRYRVPERGAVHRDERLDPPRYWPRSTSPAITLPTTKPMMPNAVVTTRPSNPPITQASPKSRPQKSPITVGCMTTSSRKTG